MKLKLSTLGVTAGLFVAAITAGSLQAQTISLTVTNNSFEAPVVGSQNIYSYATAQSYPTGWTTTGGMVWALDPNGTSSLNAEDGTQVLESFAIPAAPQYNGAGMVYQTLTNNFVVGDTYTFSIYAGESSGAAMQQGDFISINDGGTVLASTPLTNTGTGTGAWTLFTTSFTDVSSTDPITISINAVGQSGGASGLLYDNATVTQTVPEPSTWALFGVAMFCGLVFRHKLARKNA